VYFYCICRFMIYSRENANFGSKLDLVGTFGRCKNKTLLTLIKIIKKCNKKVRKHGHFNRKPVFDKIDFLNFYVGNSKTNIHFYQIFILEFTIYMVKCSKYFESFWTIYKYDFFSIIVDKHYFAWSKNLKM